MDATVGYVATFFVMIGVLLSSTATASAAIIALNAEVIPKPADIENLRMYNCSDDICGTCDLVTFLPPEYPHTHGNCAWSDEGNSVSFWVLGNGTLEATYFPNGACVGRPWSVQLYGETNTCVVNSNGKRSHILFYTGSPPTPQPNRKPTFFDQYDFLNCHDTTCTNCEPAPTVSGLVEGNCRTDMSSWMSTSIWLLGNETIELVTYDTISCIASPMTTTNFTLGVCKVFEGWSFVVHHANASPPPAPTHPPPTPALVSGIKTYKCDANCTTCILQPPFAVRPNSTIQGNCVTNPSSAGFLSESYWMFNNGTMQVQAFADKGCLGPVVAVTLVNPGQCNRDGGLNNNYYYNVFYYMNNSPWGA